MAYTAEQQAFLDFITVVGGDIKSIKIDLAKKPNLSSGKIDPSVLPDISIIDFLGNTASDAEMTAKTGQKGDWTIRTDNGKVYVITGTDPTQVSAWTALSYPASVAPAIDDFKYKDFYNTSKV